MKLEFGMFKFECGWELGLLVLLVVYAVCSTIQNIYGA